MGERLMKMFGIMAVLALLACSVIGCAGLRPQVNAGYYIVNEPTSNATVVVGSNGTQANAIHAAVGMPEGTDYKNVGVKAENGDKKTSVPGGLFVNAGQFEKTSDTDLSAALESLKHVKGSTAGLTQAAQASTGTSTQNPTNTTSDTTTLDLPIAVSQSAATATTKAKDTPQKADQGTGAAGTGDAVPGE